MYEESHLAQNTLDTVVVRGLAKDEQGHAMVLQFARTPPDGQNPLVWGTRPDALPEMPKRPPSSLPPPAHATLDIVIADELGRGRVGCVYSVQTARCSVSDHVPPLVVKITNRDRCDGLSKEAWVYEEMECLQGAGIPRCYGYFTTMLPQRTDIVSWERRPTTPFPIGILLLERVGDKLPLGEPVPQVLQDDLWGIIRDLAELGIGHHDLRYDNLLMAPRSPPGLPSMPSPYSGRSYGLRVIDFDYAYKYNMPKDRLSASSSSFVDLVLDDVPEGRIVNVFDE